MLQIQKLVSMFKDQIEKGEIITQEIAPLPTLKHEIQYNQQMESLLLSDTIVISQKQSESFLEGYDITDHLMNMQPLAVKTQRPSIQEIKNLEPNMQIPTPTAIPVSGM